ncbi:MAG TPA: GAF domain-containing SpoIIE family protein phosphatase [Acidimicrobiales bacterium]|nr:GAF domain-containing SpoIIE family protein phosphatase [Acidimicrobiales bacterium]
MTNDGDLELSDMPAQGRDRDGLRNEDGIWRLATALSGAMFPSDVASALAEQGPDAADASFASMAVLDVETNRGQLVHRSGTLPAVAARWSEFDLHDSTALCETILSGRPVLHRSMDVMGGQCAHVRDDLLAVWPGATASLPLIGANGVAIGAVGFGWSEPQQFDARQRRRLDLVARMAAQALERAALYEQEHQRPSAQERADAQLFQHACLPRVLPEGDGLELAAVYLPASDASMGGDWYDVFPVREGTCLVIGDVAGHGVGSAAVMAQLRNAVRAYADDDPSPARVVTRLNRMMCRLLPGETASVVVAIWDEQLGTILRTNAGHPPVLRCRVGEFGYLPRTTGGLLLGVDPNWVYAEETKVLRPGTTLLFYTDGLVEMRDRSLDEGMNDLVTLVEGFEDLSPDGLCETILAWRRREFRLEDDVCLLAARLTSTGG